MPEDTQAFNDPIFHPIKSLKPRPQTGFFIRLTFLDTEYLASSGLDLLNSPQRLSAVQSILNLDQDGMMHDIEPAIYAVKISHQTPRLRLWGPSSPLNHRLHYYIP